LIGDIVDMAVSIDDFRNVSYAAPH
jgi:hypothetical protein